MALAPFLDLRQSQSLVMTPQLMQSIKLLQMTALELERFLDEELEKNPLLDRLEPTQEPMPDSHAADNPYDSGKPEAPFVADDAAIPDGEVLSNMFDSSPDNIDPDALRHDAMSLVPKPVDWSDVSTQPLSFDSIDLEQTLAEKPSLRSHVSEQIIFSFSNRTLHEVALDLADQLDEAGYFTGSLEETASRLGVDLEQVSIVFDTLRQFDPPGLFATSLSDCLALQLERQNRLDPAMQIVLDNLPALAKRDFAGLAKLCGLDQSELVDMLQEIRALDPKPGMAFGAATADVVVPDVIIHALNDGDFQVELNNAVLPKLVVHQDYSLKICANADERGFIGECLQNAHWLLRALDQRAKTLLTVSGQIVRHQQDFLKYGISHLKPLNLAMVADAVGMHESTISRVTANKYVATPRGTFEMRSFFSAALQSAEGGETHAADAVRHRIRQLIDGEDVDHILSDDTLVSLLKKENIDIARRTVAKYREGMNISSSVARRREKKAKGSCN